jgi:hypothetical protein
VETRLYKSLLVSDCKNHPNRDPETTTLKLLWGSDEYEVMLRNAHFVDRLHIFIRRDRWLPGCFGRQFSALLPRMSNLQHLAVEAYELTLQQLLDANMFANTDDIIPTLAANSLARLRTFKTNLQTGTNTWRMLSSKRGLATLCLPANQLHFLDAHRTPRFWSDIYLPDSIALRIEYWGETYGRFEKEFFQLMGPHVSAIRIHFVTDNTIDFDADEPNGFHTAFQALWKNVKQIRLEPSALDIIGELSFNVVMPSTIASLGILQLHTLFHSLLHFFQPNSGIDSK